MKKLFTGAVILLALIGLHFKTVSASSCLPGNQGGTNNCTTSAGNIGKALVVSSTDANGFITWTLGTAGSSTSGGSASGTVFLLTAGNNLISLSPASITASGTISVNSSTLATFIGTLGYLTSSTGNGLYYSISNPSGFTSSTPGGNDTDVQTKNGTAFAGSDNFTFDGTNARIASPGKFCFGNNCNPVDSNGGYIFGNGGLKIVEGNNTFYVRYGNTFQTSLDAGSITGDHIYTFPDKDGTFAMTSDITGGSGGGVTTSSPTTGFAYFVNGNTISGTSTVVQSFQGATGTVLVATSGPLLANITQSGHTITVTSIPTSTLKTYTDTFGYLSSLSGALLAVNNLLDVISSSTSRINLGLKATSSLALADTNGIQTSFAGSSCAQGTVQIGNSASGTALCTPASSTAMFYVDSNRTDSYAQNGSYLYPFKTMSQAIASSTGFGAYAYILSPGTYVDGAPDTFPNVPFSIEGNESTLVEPSGVTMPNAFDIYDLTIVGNVLEADTSTAIIHQFNNSVITGNLTTAGLATVIGTVLTGTSTDLTIQTSSIMNFAGGEIFGNVVSQGFANFNNMEISASTSVPLIKSTAGSVNVFGATLINTGTGGGLDLRNGATSTPNNVGPITLVVNSSTPGSTLNCGTATCVVNSVSGFSNLAGAFVAPSGTAFLATYDENRTVLNLLTAATVNASSTQTNVINEPFFQNATSSGASTVINWNNGNKQGIVLGTATTTISFTNVKSGASYTLWVMQDGTGSRTVTWTTSGTGRIQWQNANTTPTLSTGVNAMDPISFQCFTPQTTSTLSCYGAYGSGNFAQ